MRYNPILGTVRSIMPLQNYNEIYSCTLLLAVVSPVIGQINFIVTPRTYVLRQKKFNSGDPIIAFYDTLTPAPLIYPPRYRAILLAGNDEERLAVFDYFNEELVNSDQTLKLNLADSKSNIILSNGQTFTGSPENHFLLVLFTSSTKSIPSVITPDEIVVFCYPEQYI